MKHILYLCLLSIIFYGCTGSKNYLDRGDEDRALSDAIKKINRSPGDENAINAIPVLYTNIKTRHLAKIESLKKDKDPERWKQIIKEYDDLQNAYDAIMNSAAAFKLVNAESFSSNIYDAKQSAAGEYYHNGQAYLEKSGRDNAKKAYTSFKTAVKFVPGYKDANEKAAEAYEKAIVNVVINPIQDNSFFFNSGWGNTGYNYSNEYFQQSLVRDLSGMNKDRYPARFYTDWQARRDNIQPNWVVDLKLRNIDIPYPSNYTYARNASSNIQIGTDTSGNPVYKTVYANLNITRSNFTARADMDVTISEVATRKNISYRNFREEYQWQEESATYNGDSRALSAQDWELVNRSRMGSPGKEDVLNELFKKLYPQVKNNISYAVDW